MTDINKALHAIIDEDIIQPIIYGEGVDPKSYFGIDADELVAKIKALVVDNLPKELTKFYGQGTMHIEQKVFEDCLGEIRSIYERRA